MLPPDAGGRSAEEEPLQTLVPESQDRHGAILTRNVVGYNRPTPACSRDGSRAADAGRYVSRSVCG
jgi:hypothetical protein